MPAEQLDLTARRPWQLRGHNAFKRIRSEDTLSPAPAGVHSAVAGLVLAHARDAQEQTRGYRPSLLESRRWACIPRRSRRCFT